MYIGVDLALRNTGIVVLNKKAELVRCHVICSNPKTHNNEALLQYNYNEYSSVISHLLLDFNLKCADISVGLEGLAFNSPSASVDLIAANHWNLRQWLFYNHIKINVIPPKSWQKSVITKDVLAEQSKLWPTVRAKKGKKLTKEEAASNAVSKAKRRKDTKDRILHNVPGDILVEFDKYVKDNKLSKDIVLDLADAYHIALHIVGK